MNFFSVRCHRHKRIEHNNINKQKSMLEFSFSFRVLFIFVQWDQKRFLMKLELCRILIVEVAHEILKATRHRIGLYCILYSTENEKLGWVSGKNNFFFCCQLSLESNLHNSFSLIHLCFELVIMMIVCGNWRNDVFNVPYSWLREAFPICCRGKRIFYWAGL